MNTNLVTRHFSNVALLVDFFTQQSKKHLGFRCVALHPQNPIYNIDALHQILFEVIYSWQAYKLNWNCVMSTSIFKHIQGRGGGWKLRWWTQWC